uniref:Uncharacterized protein n=1 Tax=Romanomermis culicivorax TaxID=13658 RepID=A0A915I5Z4_ROMCU
MQALNLTEEHHASLKGKLNDYNQKLRGMKSLANQGMNWCLTSVLSRRTLCVIVYTSGEAPTMAKSHHTT